MYYEEQVIDGVLCWRTDPDGEWNKFDYAKLLKAYQDASKNYYAYAQLAQERLTEIEHSHAEVEQLKSENRWIPLQTWLLPPMDTDVLVYNSFAGNVFTACRAENGWYDKHEGVDLTAYNDIITHWKNLPQPPEAE